MLNAADKEIVIYIYPYLIVRLVDMDEHWVPSSYYCSTCGFHYDYVIKYENFETEIPYLWQKLGQNVSQGRWTSPGANSKKLVKVSAN